MSVDLIWLHEGRPSDAALEARWTALVEGAAVALALGARPISVALVDDAHIHELNATWRGVDRPTDVLSFSMDEGEAIGGSVPDEARPLGDIIVSLDTAERQAAEHGHGLGDEVAFLLIHGICHLMGHDHGEPDEAAAMRQEEDRLLAAVAPTVARPPTPY